MNVLILDDDLKRQSNIIQLFQNINYNVINTDSEIIALQEIRDNDIHLIISAIYSKNIDGLQFCYRLKSDDNLFNIPFIFITSQQIDNLIKVFAGQLNVAGIILFEKQTNNIDKVFNKLLSEIENKKTIQKKCLLSKDEFYSHYAGYLNSFFSRHYQSIYQDIKNDQSANLLNSSVGKKYQELAEQLPQPIFETDADARLVFFNKSACKRFGYSEDEFSKNFNIVSLIADKHKPKAIVLFRKVLRTAKELSIEITAKNKDGMEFPVIVHGSPVIMNGAVVGARGIVIDISEQKNTIAELKRGEEKYRLLLDLAPDAFFQGDLKGNFITVNDKAVLLTGYSRDELLKMNITNLFPASTLNKKPLRYDLLELGETITAEREILCKDGRTIAIEMNSKKMPDGTYQSFFRDITERKQFENSLKLFRAQIDQSKDAIEIIDVESGKFIEINEFTSREHGYSREEYLNLHVKDIDINIDEKSYHDRIEFLKKNETLTIESIHRRKDGSSFPVEINLHYVVLDRPTIVAVARNITERKNIELEKQRRNQQIQLQQQTIIKLATHEYLSLGKVDDFIHLLTQLTSEIINCCRVSVWILNNDQSELICKGLFEAGKKKYSSGEKLNTADYPAYFKYLKKNLVVDASDALRDPKISEFTENYLRPLNIKSILDSAILLAGNFIGVVCIEQTDTIRYWTDNEIYFVGQIGELVTSVLMNNERLEHVNKIEKLNRVYSVISQINQMVVRAKDRDYILKESCRIAVEFGKFKMAWMGIYDEQQEKLLPYAWYGYEEGYLEKLSELSLLKNNRHKGPARRAFYNSEIVLIQDISGEESMAGWRHEALERGYHTVISLPISTYGKTIGTFTLYGEEGFLFDSEEVKLLEEVTSDISFALETSLLEEQKQIAEYELKASEESYRQLTELSPDAIVVHSDGKFVFLNDAAVKLLGASNAEQLIGKSILTVMHPDYIPHAKKIIGKMMSTGKSTELIEQKFIRLDGSMIDVEVASAPFLYRNLPSVLVITRDVTESKRNQLDLKLSKDRMQMIIEGTPHLFFYLQDAVGKVEYVSPSVRDITGYDESEWINQSHWFVTDSEINEIARKRTRANLNGVINDDPFLVEIKHKTGKKVLLEIFEKPVFNDNKVVGLHGVAHDITDQVESDKLLKESEARYKNFFDNDLTGDYKVSADGTILMCNKALSELLGFQSVSELMQTKVPDFYHHSEQRNTFLKQLREKKELRLYEQVLKRKDGQNVFVIENAFGTFDQNGELIEITGYMFDITNRKTAEEKLVLLAQSLGSISECVTITDMNDTLIYVNKAFSDIFGYNSEDVIGKHISIVRAEPIPDESYEEVLISSKSTPWEGELLNRKKDGSIFPIHLSTSIVKDKNNTPLAFIGVSRDITKEKQIQNELIKAKENAEKSDKLKSEFLAQMSHEIRSPIHTILSFTNLLRSEVEEFVDDDLRSTFSMIDSSSKRIIRTIDSILNMSELQTGTYQYSPKKVDVRNDIVLPIFNEYKLLASGKKIELLLTEKTSDSIIKADEYSVNQLVANLIDNAFKYTHSGKIEVTLSRDKANQFCIFVEDTGVGISREYLPNLFLPFTQEEQGYTRKYEGNGLGLALVKKYCELNNAKISVESEKGKGTKFQIIFGNP